MIYNFSPIPPTDLSSWNNKQVGQVVVVDMSTILYPTEQDLFENYPEYLDYIQKQLNRLCWQFTTTNLLLVWEFSKSEYRINLLSDYKAGRKTKHKNFKSFGQRLYHDIGTQYPSLVIKGIESDDIIAELATLSSKHVELIVVSTDRDLLQLLNQDNVKMYDFQRNQLFTKKSLCDFKVMGWRGFNPSDILPYKLIAGDSSDNIPSCASRVGRIAAMELYLRYGDPRNWTEETFDNYTGKNKAQIIDFIKNKLHLHTKLMELPNSDVLNNQQRCYINDIFTNCMNKYSKRMENIRSMNVDMTEYQQTGIAVKPTLNYSPTKGVSLLLLHHSYDGRYYTEKDFGRLVQELSRFDIKHIKEYLRLRNSKAGNIQIDFY